MNNPIIKTKPIKKEPYPITVYCVVDDLSTKNEDILIIKEYVHSLNLNFTTREFNSYKYSDDMYYISRLPAFHIYERSNYVNTFYINTRPFQIIQETLDTYKEHIRAKEMSYQRWKCFFISLTRNFKKVKPTHKSILPEWS